MTIIITITTTTITIITTNLLLTQQYPNTGHVYFSFFLKEIDSLEEIPASPYIVPFIGGAISSDYMCIVTEFCGCGNLEQWITTGAAQRTSYSDKFRMIFDIARGIQAIHKAHVLHRNIKSSNVMLSPPGSAVLCRITDFGLSRNMGTESTMAATLTKAVGAPMYMVCCSGHHEMPFNSGMCVCTC